MALNVHVTRIDANPIILEPPSTATLQSHPQVAYPVQQNAKWTSTLIHVPEDRNIRKFPVRIFDMQAEG